MGRCFGFLQRIKRDHNPKTYAKSSVGQHGPTTKAKVGSGVMKEEASSADRSHPPLALSRNYV
jgi:hypothetical protein